MDFLQLSEFAKSFTTCRSLFCNTLLALTTHASLLFSKVSPCMLHFLSLSLISKTTSTNSFPLPKCYHFGLFCFLHCTHHYLILSYPVSLLPVGQYGFERRDLICSSSLLDSQFLESIQLMRALNQCCWHENTVIAPCNVWVVFVPPDTCIGSGVAGLVLRVRVVEMVWTLKCWGLVSRSFTVLPTEGIEVVIMGFWLAPIRRWL